MSKSLYIKENLYALCVSVLDNVSVEAGLRKMDISVVETKTSVTKKDWRKAVAETGKAMLAEHEKGKTIKQLAAKYGLSVPTVKYRLYIMRKKVMN